MYTSGFLSKKKLLSLQNKQNGWRRMGRKMRKGKDMKKSLFPGTDSSYVVVLKKSLLIFSSHLLNYRDYLIKYVHLQTKVWYSLLFLLLTQFDSLSQSVSVSFFGVSHHNFHLISMFFSLMRINMHKIKTLKPIKLNQNRQQNKQTTTLASI